MDRFNLRKVYVERLIEHAESNPAIVSLDTDSREATLADKFAARFPDRAFSFGIAEQDMVTAAAGMATMGLIPFVNSYSMFIAMRALDQVRNAVAYPNLNVKIVLSHHGLDTGADGVTHQLTEDVAIFRTIPNLVLLHPADSIEMAQMVDWAIAHQGPVIIKSGKSGVPNVHGPDYRFKAGCPSVVRAGKGVAIATNGVMAERALKAAEALAADGFDPRVVNVSTLAGVDETALMAAFDGTSFVVTLEDHSKQGGLGGILAELFSEHAPKRIVRLGLGPHFAECGPPADLFRKYEMDADAVVKRVKEVARDFPELLSH
ncbi:MAG: transketolase family protein [Alphaproteobacteria bacterium]|nr:MAG: transketolase family protein [Alphaproteobacteria bacterium]